MINSNEDRYRVVRTHEPQPPSGEEYVSRLAIREFYLGGVFRTILYGENLGNLHMVLTDMLAALDKPVLDSIKDL